MTESDLSRRVFLQTTGVSGLALMVGCDSNPSMMDVDAAVDATTPMVDPSLNTWIEITPDETVFIAMHKAEMGQGVHTTLPLIVAEELDVALSQVQVRLVGELDTYRLPTGLPLTSASNSTRGAYTLLRQVGAAAREMLIQAAATQWNIDASTVSTELGACIHPNGEQLTYGALVDAARILPIPEEPTLKDPATFRYIGVSQERFADTQIVEGANRYGLDAVPDAWPDRLYAAIRHAPVSGGEPTNLDALPDPGEAIEAIVGLPHAVAVVASSYWEAWRTVTNLPITFSEPAEAAAVSSAGIRAELESALGEDGIVSGEMGDISALGDAVAQQVTTRFYAPHIAHTPLEPVNATAYVQADRCDIWLPTQSAHFVREKAVEITGLNASQIHVNPMFIGGSYGRKADTDYVEDALRIAQAVGRPVTLIWSREEDIQHDQFRPAFCGEIAGSLDADGNLIGWDAVNSGPSVLGFGERDPLSVQGFSDLAYEIPNQRVRHVYVPSPLETGFWRSIGHSQNTFFVEAFLDELAEAAGKDPLMFRLDMMTDARYRRVLEQVAELAQWGSPFTPGASQGIAFCKDYGSVIGVVCEASVEMRTRRVRIHRVSAVVDCGLAIQPTGVRAQVEGGLMFGLSAALHEEITIEGGKVQQSNFDDYRILTQREAPQIEVRIVDSTESPGGVGEIAVGPAAPALANAIYAATGTRCRRTPFMKVLGFA